MNAVRSDPMKIKTHTPVLAAVAVFPDQVQFDCPACDLTHLLMRELDFREDRDGVWRLKEEPGLECDCGVLIAADFRVTPERPPDPASEAP
ncbi:hypothetical protein NI454_01070 [Brevundimonas diminuta]|uniref:hypothetical protein n=1 Tax=Brevundimonas diminuta TaxID=293 RepID=UPI0020969353|nr:hypothetical protein [Brevundimonas diminuta]MCO8028535.1 hypothetical protein [Brevundimonas diminuta]